MPTPTPAPNSPTPNFPALPPQIMPARVIVHHRGIGRWLWWTGWLAFLITLVMLLQTQSAYQEYMQPDSGIQERYHSLAKDGPDKVAIIDVEGVIISAEGFVKAQIDRVRQDKEVKAVVLRIN